MDEEGNQLIDPITKTDIVGKEYSTEQKHLTVINLKS